MKANRIAFLVLLILVFSISLAEAGLIVFKDGDFGTHWNFGRIEIGSGGRTQSGNTNVSTGGSPGAYRLSQHSYGGRPGGRESRLVHANTLASYDPMLGAISGVSISFDAAWKTMTLNSGAEPTWVGFGAVARQNGRWFHTLGQAVYAHDIWKPMAFNLLTASSFLQSNPNAPAASLDFSLTGSPIQFGYYSYATRWFTVEADTGVDNWEARLTTTAGSQIVPEPSTVTLVVLGVIGLGCVRLRKAYRKACSVNPQSCVTS